MNKKIVSVIIAAVLILLVLAGVYSWKKSTRNVVEQIVAKNDVVNILLAGRNVYKDNTFSFFAIVTINPDNKNTGITFIPPDYKIIMNESGDKVRKISEVDFYYFEKIRHSLKKDLHLDVPFFIKIYSPDVVKTVNMLEGIDLFSLDQAGCVSNIKFGLNYLDGKKVMQYINCTEENSIYMKYDRIMDVLQTMYFKMDSRMKYSDINFITEIFKSIKTNLLSQEILSLIQLIDNKGKFFSTLLPGGFDGGYYVVDEISYQTYQQEFLTNIVVNNPSEPNTKIRILNGTRIPGLARKMRNNLMRDGLNVVEFATSKYDALHESIIVCRKCNYPDAVQVSGLTGIKNIHFITDTRQLNNILIIIGEDLAQ